ncbi:hypothetical protein QI633_02300 [Nocardioides sp. QY071]|uniref:hypothetical protein n=1 Tax=Nocardioides sp. QY071 TaxID=3044187 RepID=UPI00249C918C|nr:hypothetical protein [Nocardioides sp. QY071]WGY02597.1 hypothetical protein QI633_02300 [Nocardioides sp. QY071]
MRTHRALVILPLAAVLYASVGQAATPTLTVGGTAATPADTGGCAPDTVFWQDSVAGSSPSYTVPGKGVITSWSVMAGAGPGGIVQLKVGPEGPDNTYTIAGSSVPRALTPSVLNTFPARISVAAGDRLGLRVPSGSAVAPCSIAGTAGDTMRYISGVGPDPALGSTYVTNTAANLRINVSVQVEPDADGDGFGDVTQDQCPTRATSQGDCAAPTAGFGKYKKVLRTSGAKAKLKLTLTSTEPGSTFICSVDGKQPKPCASPFKAKLRLGKHTIHVTATDAAGYTSPAAVARIKVVR